MNKKRALLTAVLSGAFALSLLFGSLAAATTRQTELEQVQKAIKQSHARWTAGETSISRLPETERRKRVGHWSNKIPQTMADERSTVTLPLTTSTSTDTDALDYRNLNGVNYVTPVKNQGNCGDCWAFSVVATMESYLLLTNPALNANSLDLSEQTLLSCLGGGNDCDGGSPFVAADFLESPGLPTESCSPYTGLDSTSCSEACDQNYKVPSWVALNGLPTIDILKLGLVVFGPLQVDLDVYSDFYYYTGGIYSYITGSLEGLHAVELIGYDDVNQCFICKNSWGNNWGEGGFFRIAYTQISNVVQFGMGGSIAFGYGILWRSATNLGNNWEQLNWFGYFYAANVPWIYHQTLGWLYPMGTSADNIWFWDPTMNSFWWTNQTIYPYIYRASDGAWLYYAANLSSPSQHWFYNFKTGKWEND